MADPTNPATSKEVVDLLSTQVELTTRMNALLEQQYDRLAAIQNAMSGQAGVTQEAAAAINEYNDASDQMGTSNDQVKNSLDGAATSFDTFTSKIQQFIGSDAYNAITSGFSDGFNLIGVNVSSLAEAISNPLSAAMGMLAGIYDMVIKKSIELYHQLLQLQESIESIREKFGSFNENTSRRTLTAFRSLGSTIKETSANAAAFGRKFAPGIEGVQERLRLVLGIAEDLSPVMDVLGQQFNDAADNLYLLKEGLNFSGEALKQTVVLSQLAGKTLKQYSNEIMASINKIGKQFNVSTKVLGQDVSKALTNFKMLGRMTGDYVKDITKAAVFTRKLGIELNELTGIVDKFDEFEGGAEAAAQLAQGFGMVLDPLRMMGLEAGPRLQELQRAFMATGRSIDAMSRQERKLLADTAGLTEEQALLAFSSKGMSMSYDEISKGADVATKKQKSTQEIMNDVLDNIKNVVTGFKDATGFITAFFEGFGVGFGMNFMDLFMQLAQQLGKVFEIGKAVGGIFGKIFRTSEMGSGLVTFLKSIGTMFVSIAEKVEAFSKAIFDENGNLKIAEIGPAIRTMLDGVVGEIKKVFTTLPSERGFGSLVESFGLFIFEVLTEGLNWFADQIPVWTNELAGLFTDDESGVTGGLQTSFERAFEKLKTSADRLLNPEMMVSFLKSIGDSIIRFFKKYPITSIVTGLFIGGGPIMTMLGGVVTTVFTALGGIFSGSGPAAAAAAPGLDAAQAAAAEQAGSSVTAAVTEGATAAVEGGQSMLEKVFSLIEDPAKIALMASAIASAITVLGVAIRDTLIAFMDPIPGRGDNKSFIDILIDSADKFAKVPLGTLIILGVTLGAVGLGVAGVIAGLGLAAKLLTPGQAALVAMGLVAGGVASKFGLDLFSGIIGVMGALLQSFAKPFDDDNFRKSLDKMAEVKDKLPALSAASDAIKSVVEAMVKVNDNLPMLQSLLKENKPEENFVELGGANGLASSTLTDALPVITTFVNSLAIELTKMTPLAIADSQAKFDDINGMLTGLNRFANTAVRTTQNFTKAGMAEFEDRVSAIVDHIVTIRSIIEDMPTVSLEATLDKFGKNFNVAKKAFSISGGAVNVNVQLNLTMSAEKISQAVVLGGYVQPTEGYRTELQKDYERDNRFDGISETTRDNFSKDMLTSLGKK